MNEHQENVNCMDEESDINDSEINEYKNIVHIQLKLESYYKVRGLNGEVRCPFCVGEETQGYHRLLEPHRLLEHAVRVAEGTTGSGKQRASHSAMAKYLAIDLADEAQSLPHSAANRILRDLARDEKKLVDRMLSVDKEKTVSIRRMLQENDEIQHTMLQEARDLLCLARDQLKGVLEQQEALSLHFEYGRRRLNFWSQEVNKSDASLTEKKRKEKNIGDGRRSWDLEGDRGKSKIIDKKRKRGEYRIDLRVL